MDLVGRIRRKVAKLVLPAPVGCVRAEYSMLFSAHDEPVVPTPRLIEVALETVRCAVDIDVEPLCERMAEAPYYPRVWPGEHYKLLGGLVKAIQPEVVVEIGSGTGLSALALHQEQPAGGRLVTFDLVSWQEYPGGCLCEADFADGRLEQRLADLCDADVFERHRELLESADLLFVDAAKDGVMERVFLARFATLSFRQPVLVLFDDIRLWNMLGIWRNIRRPKLDLTSFGHWSGTGLIDWCAELPGGK